MIPFHHSPKVCVIIRDNKVWFNCSHLVERYPIIYYNSPFMSRHEAPRHTRVMPIMGEATLVSPQVRRHNVASFTGIRHIKSQDGLVHPTVPFTLTSSILQEDQTISSETNFPLTSEDSNFGLVYQVTRAVSLREGIPVGGFEEGAYLDTNNRRVEGFKIRLFPSMDTSTQDVLLRYLESVPANERLEEAQAIADGLPRIIINSEGGLMIAVGEDAPVVTMSPYLKTNLEVIDGDRDTHYKHNIEMTLNSSSPYYFLRTFFVKDVFRDGVGREQEALVRFRVDFGTYHFGDIAERVGAKRLDSPMLDIEKLTELVRPIYKIDLISHV